MSITHLNGYAFYHKILGGCSGSLLWCVSLVGMQHVGSLFPDQGLNHPA